MGSRFPSHQLSNGLFLLGRPEQPKEKTPINSSVALPYTGGDVKKSGELGKMFDIPTDGSRSRKSGPVTSAPSRMGSFGGAHSNSGQLNSMGRGPAAGSPSMKKTNSGPLNKHGTVEEIRALREVEFLARILVLSLPFCQLQVSLHLGLSHQAR